MGAALAGIEADLYVASGTSTSFTQVTMTDSGDDQTYTTTDTTKRYWDDTATTTIEISTDSGGTWSTPAADTYTIQYVGGVVTFTTSDNTREVRSSGKYFTIAQLGQAFDWELNATANIMDITSFGKTFKVKMGGLLDATAKASRYYLDGTFFDLLGNRLVLILYPDFSAGTRFEGYAFIKSDPLKVSVDAVIAEDLELEIDGQLYYLAS